jgi:hypothetical protein
MSNNFATNTGMEILQLIVRRTLSLYPENNVDYLSLQRNKILDDTIGAAEVRSPCPSEFDQAASKQLPPPFLTSALYSLGKQLT